MPDSPSTLEEEPVLFLDLIVSAALHGLGKPAAEQPPDEEPIATDERQGSLFLDHIRRDFID